MTKPPKEFKGNQQDWNAIESINSPEIDNMVARSAKRLFDKGLSDIINDLDDGTVFNIALFGMDQEQIEENHRQFDMGLDNQWNYYTYDKNDDWVKI